MSSYNLDFADSFSHYTQAQLGNKWNIASFVTLDNVHGRGGRTCAQMGTSGAAGDLSKSMPFTSGSWVVGFAFQIQTQGGFLNDIYLVTQSGNPGFAPFKCELQVDGTIAIIAGTSVVGVSKTALQIATWYYIEAQFFLQNTATLTIPGTVLVTGGLHINGVIEIASNTVDSHIPTAAGSGGAVIDTHNFQGPFSAFTGSYFQDPYIGDTGSYDELNYQGDLKVIPYLPTADVAGNQWTGTFANVDSNPTNDSSFISDSTPSDQSYFTFQSISGFTGSIHGVLSVARARGGVGEKIELTIGTKASHSSSFAMGLPTNFAFLVFGWTINDDPTVAAPWSVGNFNAETFGVFRV